MAPLKFQVLTSPGNDLVIDLCELLNSAIIVLIILCG